MVLNDDAAPFVAKGKTAFCKFVVDCDPEIRAYEEVLLVDKDDKLLATGQALLAAPEIPGLQARFRGERTLRRQRKRDGRRAIFITTLSSLQCSSESFLRRSAGN